MILFIILLLILTLLTIFIIMIASIGGATLVVIFGDVIVCAVIIGFIMKHILKKRKEKRNGS